MSQLSKYEKLQIKIMEILADYKFNDTKIETCEMVAQRIFELIINSKIKRNSADDVKEVKT